MMTRGIDKLLLKLVVLIAAMAGTMPAAAFCGFYVSGADAELFNNATLVVMMRHGQRTVLSMQNNYQGPPKDFAMVVPVPVVLQKENVKTLPDEIFDRVDKLAAPRLVEYWEQDPCFVEPEYDRAADGEMPPTAESKAVDEPTEAVKVEAQFEVGEYEIVILSAQDAGALDQWLRGNGYQIPAGAEPLLRPYVQGGMKFFVAKVNAQKVRFHQGQAMLSPLRFHYDSQDFRLPVRLGLVNSSGKQDLIVHVLAEERYEVANYANAFIPTNIDVDEQARSSFGAFYAALFDATLAQKPGAVVTEYAWSAQSCDPCPSPPLDQEELMTLGGDVVQMSPYKTVLTRLHARYDAKALGEDLVFKKVGPMVGGREFMADGGRLETGASSGSINNFQGRYAIRHPWKGEITCDNPIRGRWGGPPGGGEPKPQAAQDLAFAPRGSIELAGYVEHDVAEIGLKAKQPTVAHAGAVPESTPSEGTEPVVTSPVHPSTPSTTAPGGGGCGSCVAGGDGDTSALWWLAGLVLLGRGRRRR